MTLLEFHNRNFCEIKLTPVRNIAARTGAIDLESMKADPVITSSKQDMRIDDPHALGLFLAVILDLESESIGDRVAHDLLDLTLCSGH